MTPRKAGICTKCGTPLYGDEYGACGHECLESEMQELENYKKCVQEILDLLRDEVTSDLSAERLSLVGDVIKILKSEKFGNIDEKHMPWNYKK